MNKFNNLVAEQYKKLIGEAANVPPPNVVNDNGADQSQAPDNAPDASNAANNSTTPTTEEQPKSGINNNNIAFYTKSMISAILNADKISNENKAKLAELQGTITADNSYTVLQQIIGMTSDETENVDSLPNDGTTD